MSHKVINSQKLSFVQFGTKEKLRKKEKTFRMFKETNFHYCLAYKTKTFES